MTSEKTSVTWISDMIALVYKKELMWDALELVLDNLSCSSFTSKQIIKLLLHELKTLHYSQCKCSNNDDNIGDEIESGTNVVESTDQNEESQFKETSVPIKDFQVKEIGEKIIIEKENDDKRNNLNGNSAFYKVEGISFDISDSDEDEVENQNDTHESELVKEKVNKCNETTRHMQEFELFDEPEQNYFSLDLESDFSSETSPQNDSNQSRNKKLLKKIHKCQVCFKTFPSSSKLERHENIHTGSKDGKKRPKKMYECKTCFNKFVTPSKLERHENIHTGKKMFQCELCAKRFTQIHHLKTHLFKAACLTQVKRLRSVKKYQNPEIQDPDYKNRKYVCQICSKRFITPAKLERHERFHGGIKIFQCETCEKRFSQMAHLNEHLSKASHKTEKPCICEVCPERFLTPSDLKTHEMNHTESMSVQKSEHSLVVEHLIAKYNI